MLLACVSAQDDFIPTFGNRPIDKLPKSHHAEAEDYRGWNDPPPPDRFELALHMKDLFRIGDAGMERLVVVEARCPEGEEGATELVLTGIRAGETWRTQVTWLGTNQRMRPYWLPLTSDGAARLTLARGDARLAERRARLSDDAPPILIAAEPVRPIPAVDAGYALLGANEMVVQPGGSIDIRWATSPHFVGRGTVNVLADEQGRESLLATRDWAGGDGPVSLSLRVRAPEQPGDHALRITARRGDELVTEERFTLHVADRPDIEFGARYAELTYTLPVTTADGERPWDSLWTDPAKRDVVVSFPGTDARFTFWRGTNYVACWALPEAWLTYEWLEAEPDFHGAVGCVEPLQDKNCESSKVEVMRSSPARAVVRWQYDLVDLELKNIRDEHAEEVFTFYPDGIGTRYLRGFYESGWHETQEFIVINRPGRTPSQALDPQAVTFLSPDGERQDPVWPKPGFSVDGWPQVISVINLGSDRGQKPFMVTPGAPYQAKVWADPFVDKPELFNCYPHWPVTRGMETSWLEDPADFRRPTHTNLVNLVSDPVRQTGEEKDFLWLIGLADRPGDALAAARCWLRPGSIEREGADEPDVYDQQERAYVIQAEGRIETLEFTLVPEDGVPVVNPAFIVRGWAWDCEGSVDGAEEVRAEREAGSLEVWARGTFSTPTRVTLRRAEQR